MKNRTRRVTTYENSWVGSGHRLHAQARTVESVIGERTVAMPNGCWAYNGDLANYGQVRAYKGGPLVQVHRYVYELIHGEIHEGKHVHHRCENPGCINPRHLKAVTPEQHAAIHAELRRERKGAA